MKTAQNRARSRTLPPTTAFVGTSLSLAVLYVAAGAPTPLLVLLERQWEFPSSLLTIAFAAYAIGLLAALLVAGGLSDYLGRRLVIIVALAVEIVAMLMFVFADGIEWIIAARTLQGIATGAATSAFAAAVIELAPDKHKKLATIIVGSAAAGGLGIGALASGIAVQYSAVPELLLFGSLAVLMGIGILVALFARETATPHAGAWASLAPQIRVPRLARTEFAATIPGLVGSWMLAALFLGLVPSIISDVFHIDSGLLDGVTAFSEPAAAAVAGFALGALTPRRTMIVGIASVLIGSLMIVASIFAASIPLLIFGGIVGGVGFGAVFSGTIRIIGPMVAAPERASTFAAVYIVSYLAFGVPAIIAGQLLAAVGLFSTAVGFVVAIVALSAAALIVQVRAARRRPIGNGQPAGHDRAQEDQQ